MPHDSSKVLLGQTQSSCREVPETFGSDPATFLAGLAVRRTTGNLLSVTKSAGGWAGVSLGKSLSDHKKTAVLSSGLRVPVLLELTPARQVVTISSYANLVLAGDDTLKIGATTFTFKAVPSTESQVAAATDNATTAAALVTKINAHSVAGTLFVASALSNVVTITAKNNATLGASIDCVYTDSGTSTIGLTVADDAVAFVGGGVDQADWIVIGAYAYFSDTTGKADDPHSAATISNAVYVSGVMTGVDESGAEVAVALVDLQGGL